MTDDMPTASRTDVRKRILDSSRWFNKKIQKKKSEIRETASDTHDDLLIHFQISPQRKTQCGGKRLRKEVKIIPVG
jgi:hypothetical protein